MKKRAPLIVGLTGPIGAGKSTVARLLSSLGASVFDADKIVHEALLPEGRAFSRVVRLFPETISRGKIDRKKLGALVFSNAQALEKLEKITHPLVRAARDKFLREEKKKGTLVVLMEIPLLFETGADRICDRILCVTAPKTIRKNRVMRRRGMTKEKWKEIEKKQMPAQEKKRRSTYVLSTRKDLKKTRRDLLRLWKKMTEDKKNA